MFKIEMKLQGLEEVKKLFSKERLKKVLLNTINDTARLDVKKDIVDEMQKVFDRPTPYTLNSVYTRLNSTDMSVDIGLKEWGGKGTAAAEYLKPQVFGGSRPMKRSERYLGSYYVPGKGARLNQYGNMSGAQITQILSALKLFPEVGYMANVTALSRRRNKRIRNFFIIRNPGSNLHPGVYEKMANGSIKCVLIFIGSPSYSIRLKWFEVIRDSVNRNIQRRFNENFDRVFRVSGG
jgi:hypothetical protein